MFNNQKDLTADELSALRFDLRISLSPWQLEALLSLMDHLSLENLRELLHTELERRG